MLEEESETHVVAEKEEEVREVPALRRMRYVAIPPPQCAADAHEPLVWSETPVEIEETPDPKNYREDTDDEVDMITRVWVDDTAIYH